MAQGRFAGIGLLMLAVLVSANGQSREESVSREGRLTAGSMTAATTSDNQRHIAETFVQKQLGLWQERLGLKDWKITIVMARRSDLKPETLGSTHWDKDKKCATITVLDPRDYSLAFPDVLNDLEVTVVHELVHLDLAALPRSEGSRGTEEKAVVKLANALVALDRQNEGRN